VGFPSVRCRSFELSKWDRLAPSAAGKRERRVHVKRLRLGILTLAVLVAGAAAGMAAADPTNSPRSTPVTVHCGTMSFDTVTNGNGNFAPAHDLNSTSVLVPVAFGGDSGVFTDPSGTPHPFTDPPSSKGSAAPKGATLLDCSFHIDVTFPDGSSLVVDGTVTGFVTPNKG
jgi:hypothetical protein